MFVADHGIQGAEIVSEVIVNVLIICLLFLTFGRANESLKYFLSS